MAESPLVLNRRQSRLVDRWAIERYGLSGLVLMENAGRGAVDVVEAVGLRGPFVVCCGGGNNGGDGLVMARHFDERGYAVKIALFASPDALAGDAAVNYEIVRRAGLPIEIFAAPTLDVARFDAVTTDAGCLVDALLGTGSRGDPRPPLDAVIDAVNRRRAPVVAVDLPSGLDCDTGAAAGSTIRADRTVTFVAAKPGLVADAAAPWVGRLHVVRLGLPRKLMDEVARA